MTSFGIDNFRAFLDPVGAVRRAFRAVILKLNENARIMVSEGDFANNEDVGLLLDAHSLAVLASSDRGHPHAILIVYATTEDHDTFIFVIHRSTSTYANLKSDGRASLLIDSRENMAEAMTAVEGVSITGVAWEVKNGDEYDKLRDTYLSSNPMMESFVDDNETAIFKLKVSALGYIANYGYENHWGQQTGFEEV